VADRIIENPIINSPYRAPARYFKFDNEGITNEIVAGRRPSSYFVPVPRPRKRGRQIELEFTEFTADQIRLNDFVNQVRDRVDIWRQRGRPHVTPTTRRLLEYWTDPERSNPILFCQLEAAETAIYLAEAATKDNQAWIRNRLGDINTEHNQSLNRVALKMATGSGKTVVMAMLIAWQTLNKVASPNDARFTQRFLVVSPGLTIKDRLRVLLPENKPNYYSERMLVPADLETDLGQAKIVITNYHAFKRRETKQGQAIGSLTKQMLAGSARAASPFLESWSQVATRICKPLGGTSGIMVLNDEAHHCYQDRLANPEAEAIIDLKGEDKAEAEKNTQAARLWFNGLRAVNEKLGVKTVYDLSATPSFLSGSGYREGTLFPWVVSDFALVEAIESGIVKIPRVPVDDNATTPDVKYLHLWEAIGADLPKKGRSAGEVTPDQMPAALEGAIQSLYDSYGKSYAIWEKSEARDQGQPAPVFIVVCNNTTVSKMVYDFIAGWEKPIGKDKTVLVPGNLDLFSNVAGGKWIDRPRTILVDSQQFESDEGLSAEFKKVAAAEIEEFRAEYAKIPGKKAEDIDDAQILREVMNTVGKRGKLGEPVRCVVSVSMLTEGWDANTVTHILGVRAFGSQLLCEQVVGRGLRRQSYEPDENGCFPAEYADVYGVPFQFMPTVAKTRDLKIKPTRSVYAVPDRAEARIIYPRLAGYRIELPDEPMYANFTDQSHLTLTTDDMPTEVVVSGLIGDQGTHTLDDLKAKREQEIAYRLARRVMEFFDRDREEDPRPWYFPQVLIITKEWMSECVSYRDGTFPGLFLIAETADQAARTILHHSISIQRGNRRPELRPLFRQGERTGSTDDVDFATTKEVIATSKERCHVNFVVLDGQKGNSWEQAVAELLEALPDVAAYVKNDHVGFTIPYTMAGRGHQYVPDFLVRLKRRSPAEVERTLIVEVSGTLKKAGPTKEKADTARNLWVPAVNNVGTSGLWGYTELTDPSKFRSGLEAAIDNLYAAPEGRYVRSASESDSPNAVRSGR